MDGVCQYTSLASLPATEGVVTPVSTVTVLMATTRECTTVMSIA